MSDRHTNRGGRNKRELAGMGFGNLLVIEDTGKRKSRRPIWRCECVCGAVVEILGKYLINGDTKSCGCYAKGNAHNRDAVGEITKSIWTPIERQATRRGIPFQLTREEAWKLFELQDRKCALTGYPIKFSVNIRDQRDHQTASLDRVDNTKGYCIDNVQWVHKKINIMKNIMSNAELVTWSKRILEWASKG